MSVKINLVYTPEVQLAPQSFKDGLQKAATILESSLPNDNATINIKIYYRGAGSGAYASPVGGAYLAYGQVRDLLINHAGNSTTVFNSLPKESTLQGASKVMMWNAQLKVLGLTNPNGSELDGSATFATGISSNVLVGVALHEFTHVLGRVVLGPTPDVFNFFRFTGENTRLFTGGSRSAPAYFSVDNGKTKLTNYGTSSDPGDFSNSTASGDPFSEWANSNTTQTLTPLGLKQMEVLGYNINSSSTKIDPITGSRVALKSAPRAFVLDSSKGVNKIRGFNAKRGDVLIFDQENYQHTLEVPDAPLDKGEISYNRHNGFVYLNTNGQSEVIANLHNHPFLAPSNFAAI